MNSIAHVHRLRHSPRVKTFFLLALLLGLCSLGTVVLLKGQQMVNQSQTFQEQLQQIETEKNELQQHVATLSAELAILQNEDTRKTNIDLKDRINQIEKTYLVISKTIEAISDARTQGVTVTAFETELAKQIAVLGQGEYQKVTEENLLLNQKIAAEVSKKQIVVAQTAPPAQDLPAAGSYRRQSVKTERGDFTISLVAEKISSVKLITDTGNDDTCADNCQVLPLAAYVARNGGFAGINGSYFCPPDYPSCVGKINSFNTLVFNARLKKYMNSDQNVYSTVPMVVQNADRSLRFMGQTLEWGRDTGIIGGIANHPMLVSGSRPVTTDSAGKTNRGFIAVKGDTLYIGVVHAAALGDAALALAAMGVEQAINLDGGGSSALYYNGSYKVGPGRNLPNAVILAR